MTAFDSDLEEWLKDPEFAREYTLHKAKLDVSKNPTFNVKIEFHMINGVHFNPSMRDLSAEELEEEVREAYISWVDTWCGEDKDTLRDFIQVKRVE